MKITNTILNKELSIADLLGILCYEERLGNQITLQAEYNQTLVTITDCKELRIKSKFAVSDLKELLHKTKFEPNYIDLGRKLKLIEYNYDLGNHCDICHKHSDILLDCLLPKEKDYRWEVTCPTCFEEHDCSLGTGKGQRLLDVRED
ncbi:hypothetical protein UT300012_21900 [Paraclostridium bifermentans]